MEIFKPAEMSDRVYRVELQDITIEDIKGKNAVRILWLMTDEYRAGNCFIQTLYISSKFGIDKTKDFLKKLNSGITVYYDNLDQFRYTLMQVLERTKNSAYTIEQYTTKTGWIEHKLVKNYI